MKFLPLLIVLALPLEASAAIHLPKEGAQESGPFPLEQSTRPLALPPGVLSLELGAQYRSYRPPTWDPTGRGGRRSSGELAAAAGILPGLELGLRLQLGPRTYFEQPLFRSVTPGFTGRYQLRSGAWRIAFELDFFVDEFSARGFRTFTPALRLRRPLGDRWRIDLAFEWAFQFSGRHWASFTGSLPLAVTLDLGRGGFLALETGAVPFGLIDGWVVSPLGLRGGMTFPISGTALSFELSGALSLPDFLRLPRPVYTAPGTFYESWAIIRENAFSVRSVLVGLRLILRRDPARRQSSAVEAASGLR